MRNLCFYNPSGKIVAVPLTTIARKQTINKLMECTERVLPKVRPYPWPEEVVAQTEIIRKNHTCRGIKGNKQISAVKHSNRASYT